MEYAIAVSAFEQKHKEQKDNLSFESASELLNDALDLLNEQRDNFISLCLKSNKFKDDIDIVITQIPFLQDGIKRFKAFSEADNAYQANEEDDQNFLYFLNNFFEYLLDDLKDPKRHNIGNTGTLTIGTINCFFERIRLKEIPEF